MTAALYVGGAKISAGGASLSIAAAAQTISYTPSTAVIANPERGPFYYTETHYRSDNTGYVPIDSTALNTQVAAGVTQVFRYFYLEKYLSTDTIDGTFLGLVAADIATVRAAGAKLIPRFAYYDVYNPTSPYGNPDPPVARVLAHISALASTLNAGADVIEAIQAGFVGTWGEWYYTANYSTSLGVMSAQNLIDRNAILNALLDLDSKIFVLVRYAGLKPLLFGQTTRPSDPTLGAKWDRVGYHNDAMLADAGEFGTYETFPWTGWSSHPADGKAFMQAQTGVPFGGEIANNVVTYSAFKTSMQTYRANFWNPSDFGGSQAAQGWTADNLNEISRLLGYRLRLTSATLPVSGAAGASVAVSINLANDGWAAPLRSHTVYLDFDNGSTVTSRTLSIDIRTIAASANATISGTVALPVAGTWSMHLRFADPARPTDVKYSIQLANTGVWNSTLGRNNLGANVTVT